MFSMQPNISLIKIICVFCVFWLVQMFEALFSVRGKQGGYLLGKDAKAALGKSNSWKWKIKKVKK